METVTYTCMCLELKGRTINTKPGVTLATESAEVFSVGQKRQF